MRVILKKRTPFVTFSFLKFGRKSTNLYDSKLSEFLSKGERAIFIQLGKKEEKDIFGPEFTERLDDIKMPASKLETLIKLLRKQITEYGRTNQVASKKFQEMLETTIQEYHNRRKFLSEEEAGETQEATAESIIKNATEQALNILKEMQADRESFRKLGLTFEEKAFYDILIASCQYLFLLCSV